MSRRLNREWTIFRSIEDGAGQKCVDLFDRHNGTFGFEEFRKDPEDGGSWTPVHYFSGREFPNADEALRAAKEAVAWLRDVI
ncbi:MAG: hypothetical protein EOS42_00865 [Mesorhizobium sp.]|nr:MAG: hypothetical protein EOS42_00865 [Mesorhizobium sp.]